MADPLNLQIVDAMIVEMEAITGIGSVYSYFLNDEEVESKPAICLYATEELSDQQDGVESTRRRLWGMNVGIVLYTSSDTGRADIYDLVRLIDDKFDGNTSLGLGFVQSCRLTGKTIANLGSKDPEYGIKGMAEVTAHVRFRAQIGVA